MNRNVTLKHKARVFVQLSPDRSVQLNWEGRTLKRGTYVSVGAAVCRSYDHSDLAVLPLLEEENCFLLEREVA